MQQTTNYNLLKPDDNEAFDQQAHANGNMDRIDAALTPTADPTQAPAGNGPGKLLQWISWLTNRIKAITGKANWWDAPDTTLAAAKVHADATNAHGATSVATANRIVLRDAAGRAKVEAPSASDDIARKAEVDTAAAAGVSAASAVQASLNAHMNESMPHKFLSGGVTYRWGLAVVDGVVNMVYEEVV